MDLALHISNGIISGPVSAAYAVIALALLALCLQRSRRELSDRMTPLAGLVAAFVFAAQMLNFPVLGGVSGHLLGGALAAALVGPWVGALCVSVVLIVQAVFFADGGITALGLNIMNMALLATAVGYLIIVGLMKLLPRTPFGLGAAVFAASVVSVILASQGFLLQFALGGGVELTHSYGALAGYLAGVHTLIGLGEGVIAAVTVTAVAKVRPDLVYALRGARLDGTHTITPRRLAWAGGAVALVLAGGVSYLASAAPDGLEASLRRGCELDAAGEIIGGTCIAQRVADHELAGSLLADYAVAGMDSLAGLAGVIGVLLTLAAGLVLFRVLRRERVSA